MIGATIIMLAFKSQVMGLASGAGIGFLVVE